MDWNALLKFYMWTAIGHTTLVMGLWALTILAHWGLRIWQWIDDETCHVDGRKYPTIFAVFTRKYLACTDHSEFWDFIAFAWFFGGLFACWLWPIVYPLLIGTGLAHGARWFRRFTKKVNKAIKEK